jgi:hypothetical protein
MDSSQRPQQLSGSTSPTPFYQHRLLRRSDAAAQRRLHAALERARYQELEHGSGGRPGAGGKGYFALNVTDPDATYANENSARSAVLWEFTDEDDTYPVDSSGTPLGGAIGAITDSDGNPVKDLGYSGEPAHGGHEQRRRRRLPADRKEWVAVFGNGPNSTAGIAKLFVLFMDRGLNGWGAGDFVKLNTGFGVQSPPHPLAGLPQLRGQPGGRGYRPERHRRPRLCRRPAGQPVPLRPVAMPIPTTGR